MRSEKPNYINQKIKKVSEVDLKTALKEVNEKNKKLRESFIISHKDLLFTCF